MERWELKMICAAVALVVSVVCSFLPFLLIHVNCKRPKTRFQEKKEIANPPNSNHPGTEMPSNCVVIDKEDVNDNSSLPSPQENIGERNNAKTEQSVEDEHSDLKVMGYLMCFGGGVFLGTFLLHMLPEVTELIQTSLMKPHGIDYNLAELLIGVGFFLILFVEESANACRKVKTRRSSEQISTSDAHSSERDNDESIKSNSGSIRLDEFSVDTGFDNSNEAVDRQNGVVVAHRDKPGDIHNEHHHNHHHHSTRSIALVLALSLHHIFEGLSIGLQKYFGNVWHLTVAVLCHETAICFSMGLQFYKGDRKLKKRVFAILLVAAVIMPLGIVLGIAISEAHQDESQEDPQDWKNILNGVLQALACGTFIYVTFFEILCDELTNGNSSPVKIIFVGLGFTLMALLGLIPEAPDSHKNLQNPTNSTSSIYLTTPN